MATCFVIQPFDAGKYDKRFADVFAPAIRAAGLEPYRVDQDPNVEVPIDAIETGISVASVCLADITTDNPNVWYELGYAFASGRPVVMLCSDERTGRKYPFDIQHRTIIAYLSESPQDFEKLKQEITARIQALAQRGDAMRRLAETEQVAPLEGLSQPELLVLASVAGIRTEPGGGLSVHLAKQDVERAGFTPIGFALGLRRLQRKGLIDLFNVDDRDGTYEALKVTGEGWDWIERNVDKFILRKPDSNPDAPPGF
jgi:nucleoside 2-deoxyribosyltransferase